MDEHLRECMRRKEKALGLDFGRKVQVNAQAGNVYFIQAKGTGHSPIMIGFSKSVDQRLDSLQTAHGDELRVLAIIQNVEPLVERKLLKSFDSINLRGEWFHANVKLKYFIDFIRGESDVEKILERAEEIRAELLRIREKIKGGAASPLALHLHEKHLFS